jgi:hypothetical protein
MTHLILIFLTGLSIFGSPNLEKFEGNCPATFITDFDCENYSQMDPRVEVIAFSILNWKREQENGIWWACGKSLNDLEQKELSYKIAQSVMLTTDNFLENGYFLNPEDLVLTMAIESKFDPCAVGKRARQFAYDNKIWKKKGIESFSREDIEKLIAFRKKTKSNFNIDFGLTQILWPMHYSGPHKDMIDIEFNIELAARLLKKWHKGEKTKSIFLWKGISEKNIQKRRNNLKSLRFQFVVPLNKSEEK